MERVFTRLPFEELRQAYEEVMAEEPPPGMDPKKGFEIESPDGGYLLCVYITKEGELTIEVRPPRGSYAAFENMTYGEIADAMSGDKA